MHQRGSGVLLPIPSLPSPSGIGDLGPGAYLFTNFLARCKQKYWQVLPLNPTDPVNGNSPYSSESSFAGNQLFISPEQLYQQDLLKKDDIEPARAFNPEKIDYPRVTTYKENLLHLAYNNFLKKKKMHEFENFCSEHAHWLNDYAVYTALKKYHNGSCWNLWSKDLQNYDPASITRISDDLKDTIHQAKFFQYLFFTQWLSLKKYCNEQGIHIIGDIPYYVNFDSADVWTHQHLFKLGKDKKMTHVSGVPPDYFSRTGQRWGNPVFKWEMLKKDNFSWWVERIKHNLKLFDIIRIDHFLGFSACWEIPAQEKTAIKGKWAQVPGHDLFNTLRASFPALPIIAEDLGYITDDVRKLIHNFEFPGMKVLQFAFGDNFTNPYLPHNHIQNCVVYTGTHDNNTTKGWFTRDASLKVKKNLSRYLGRKVEAKNIHATLIRLAMMSVANTVIIPLQDILGLDENARMNKPGTIEANWEWRLQEDQLTPNLEKTLLKLTETYNRI